MFWFVCCLVSWIYAIKIISESLNQYKSGSISFVVETTYLKWNTEFPTISICQSEDLDRSQEYLQRTNPNISEDDLLPLQMVVNEIAFFIGDANEISNCEDLECPRDNMRKIADQIRKPCHLLFRHCEWNDKPFSCCKHFLWLETEIGACFSINNIQARNFSKKTKFPMISNRTTGPGNLKVQLNSDSAVYLMSKEDVPYINAKKHIAKMDNRLTLRFYVADVINENEVKDVAIDQRQCRFPRENYLHTYSYYAYSSCIVDCHRKAQLEKCNCTTHFMPGTVSDLFCDLKGLQCLNEHKAVLKELTDVWDHERTGLKCHCLQSCEETDLTVFFYKYSKSLEGNGYAEVNIVMDHLPSERYMRKVVRDKLDMVVSTGSTIGLFLGASLLSLVEFIHYFVLPCFERKRPDSPIQTEQSQPLVITHRRFAHLDSRLASMRNYQHSKPYQITVINVK